MYRLLSAQSHSLYGALQTLDTLIKRHKKNGYKTKDSIYISKEMVGKEIIYSVYQQMIKKKK